VFSQTWRTATCEVSAPRVHVVAKGAFGFLLPFNDKVGYSPLSASVQRLQVCQRLTFTADDSGRLSVLYGFVYSLNSEQVNHVGCRRASLLGSFAAKSCRVGWTDFN
jgi:hypothetical protein